VSEEYALNRISKGDGKYLPNVADHPSGLAVSAFSLRHGRHLGMIKQACV
jgi:hypothetical protein